MANSLKIRVGVEASKPDSKFTVQEGGAIILRNDAGAKLKINFGGSSPLCPVAATAAAPPPSFDLAVNETMEYKACAVVTERAFPYTVTVGNAQTERATIIVEKGQVMTPEVPVPPSPNPTIVIHRELIGENYFFAAAGLLLGVVLCLFVENRFSSGRNRPRP